jgi:hypothetical protein
MLFCVEDPLPHATQTKATHAAKNGKARLGAEAKTSGTKPVAFARHDWNSITDLLLKRFGGI